MKPKRKKPDPADVIPEEDKLRYQHVKHTFEPVYDQNSELLILGTFPSVKSREQNFYYGHPQNRFWKVLARLTEEKLPETIEEKKAMLLKHHIAVWDVIAGCDIIGSSDSSIKNVVPADIGIILSKAEIDRIFANGKKAESLYRKYIFPKTKIPVTVLPSTSPANAAFSFEKLAAAWKEKIGGEPGKS